MIGKTISHYKILEKLGEGGMGVVYKAEDMKLKRMVALKFLPHELTRDEESKKRFVQEAQAAAILNHPGITTVHEIDEVEGETFIAMEYIEGQTLSEKLGSGLMTIDEAIDLAIQIAEGLQTAHEKGIVHRDIKSANIMVTATGKAKIMDFGLAKMARDTLVTKEGTTLGTAAYMSPEQARGETVDNRTDIWSFGVVLYEMFTGQRPFQGEYETALVYLILNADPKLPRDLREDIPQEIERIVLRALQKDREARYGSINEVNKELSEYQSRLAKSEIRLAKGIRFLRRIKTPKIAIPAIVMILTLAVVLAWFLNRRAKIQWAREQAIPEVERLAKEWNFTAAYRLAVEAEKYIPAENHLNDVLSKISTYVSVQTDPAGADIYIKEYSANESDWQFLGQSPVDSLRMPFFTLYRWRIEKTGYETVMAVGATIIDTLYRKLDVQETIPSGMVRVIGNLPDFFIDKYEVSNRQFKEFVDAGGYEKKEYWRQEFIKSAKVLTWEVAMAEFRDTTGRPGPSTWAAGDYPDGQDDYPVSGVSWYEAAAYAEFAGKNLPTVQHWQIASGIDLLPNQFSYAHLIPMNNFRGNGALAIGSSQGMSSFGLYDMAGNVREWCWNETQDGRAVRGGAWNDVVYMYSQVSQLSPFDRSPQNGFRCVRYIDMEKIPRGVFQPIQESGLREYDKEKPVSDAIFQVYKNQFLYDKTELHSDVYETDESPDDWRIEKITFNAAYGNERVIAFLYLPKQAAPPYQTIVYFPGAYPSWETSTSINDNQDLFWFLDFILKNGRAVMYPVYKGTWERWDHISNEVRRANQSHGHTEYIVQVVKDFSRSIDYLETRPDIDGERLAFLGMSWGGKLGAIIPAVEERLKANILITGGFEKFQKARPEADAINYISRVKIPTLMLNGRYDYFLPLESSVKPMYELLGAPKADKRLIVYETDHYVPKNELIKETLRWLDKYLGPAK